MSNSFLEGRVFVLQMVMHSLIRTALWLHSGHITGKKKMKFLVRLHQHQDSNSQSLATERMCILCWTNFHSVLSSDTVISKMQPKSLDAGYPGRTQWLEGQRKHWLTSHHKILCTFWVFVPISQMTYSKILLLFLCWKKIRRARQFLSYKKVKKKKNRKVKC